MSQGSTAGREGSSLGDKAAGLGKEALGNAKQGLGSLTGNDGLKRDGVEQERTGEMQQGKRPDADR
ncbi:MAG: CsbD family protein [Alphaproteobacteria bacterium]|nr:MAG: CsbD family protein [Alphaproteobacteria bacterium]